VNIIARISYNFRPYFCGKVDCGKTGEKNELPKSPSLSYNLGSRLPKYRPLSMPQAFCQRRPCAWPPARRPETVESYAPNTLGNRRTWPPLV
jgi:hypothetical protein